MTAPVSWTLTWAGATQYFAVDSAKEVLGECGHTGWDGFGFVRLMWIPAHGFLSPMGLGMVGVKLRRGEERLLDHSLICNQSADSSTVGRFRVNLGKAWP